MHICSWAVILSELNRRPQFLHSLRSLLVIEEDPVEGDLFPNVDAGGTRGESPNDFAEEPYKIITFLLNKYLLVNLFDKYFNFNFSNLWSLETKEPLF